MKFKDIFSFGVPGLIDTFTGKNNPADDAMQYYEQIPGYGGAYLKDYVKQGQEASGQLLPQFQQMAQDPSSLINSLMGSYQESPAFQAQMDLISPSLKADAAAGGYAGTDADYLKRMKLAQKLASTDIFNWMDRALGQQESGLKGLEGFTGRGYGASRDLSDIATQALASQAGAAYQGGAQQAKNQGDMLRALMGIGRAITTGDASSVGGFW